ncbi:MAG TPA: sigma factor-like helix-turn-helix DNA-binding protein, partial [Fimbriiglobus sp.]|nr:sigma factor-like helix-turn-helix DNA-binding protein [Fimbriiglobus sp.]
DHATAEDAFQAAFLALARNAGAVRDRAAVAGWLHAAAVRVARKARTRSARARRAPVVAPRSPRNPLDTLTGRELLALIDEEIARLPEGPRAAVVACVVQGLSQEAAARRLGWSPGSLKGRLERGREKLRRALVRRGVAPTAVLAAATGAARAVPPDLFAWAVEASGGSAPAAVAELASVVGAPVWVKSLALLGVLTATGVACTVLAAGPPAAPPDPPRPQPRESAGRVDRFGDPLPDGAVLRLGTIGFKVPNVGGVGFRANGELVALGGSPLTLYRWPSLDSATPKTIAISDQTVSRRALSPDGRFAAAVRNQRLTVWDITGERPESVLSREALGVDRLTFSPKGEWLAMNEEGNSVGRLHLCYLPTKAWRELPVRTTYVESLSFTPDGKRFAVVSVMNVWVVDTATGQEVMKTTAKGYRPQWAGLNPAGDTLAILPMGFLGGKPPEVRFLSVPSGEPTVGLTPPPAVSAGWVSFAPDEKSLLVSGNPGVRWWDPVKKVMVRTLTGPADDPPVFSPDGRRLASHSRNAVLVWDAATGEPVRPDVDSAGHRDAILGVEVSPDGRRIATNGLDREVLVWTADTGRLLCRINAIWGNDQLVAFTSDSRSVVTVADDYVTPILCDATTGRVIRRFAVPEDRAGKEHTVYVSLSADGKTLTTHAGATTAGKPGSLVRWDVDTGKPIDRTELPSRMLDEIARTVFSPDGRWVVRYGKVSRFGAAESFEIVPPSEGGLFSAQFSADSRLVAQPRMFRSQAKYDPTRDTVIVFDLTSRKKLAELPTGQPQRLAFSPDARTLAVVGRDDIALWELASGKRVRRFGVGGGRITRPGAIAFTPDGRRLVTGHDDCTALVWDLTGTGRASVASANQLKTWWDALAGADAGAAYRAGWELSDRPGQAVALLRERLKPVRPTPAETVNALVRRLDATAFADREAAERALRDLGDAAVPALRAAIKGELSAEQRQRVEAVLRDADVTALPPGDRLRAVRAVAVLERVGSAEARALLAKWADGLASARLTREAKAALARVR